MNPRATKDCAACGRTIRWRQKWARDWDAVRYCSEQCRRRRVGAVDKALEAKIINLLRKRARGATICPSEAARAVASGDEWRSLMEPTRRAARRLVSQNKLEITQKGRIVDPSTAKGPIRLRLRDRPAED